MREPPPDREEPGRAAGSAVPILVGSGAIAGVLLGVTYELCENVLQGSDVLPQIGLPVAVAIVAALITLIALGRRGDAGTPLALIGAWALLVPACAGITTWGIGLVTSDVQYASYHEHRIVQSAVRSLIGVAAVLALFVRVWLRRRAAEALAARRALDE